MNMNGLSFLMNEAGDFAEMRDLLQLMKFKNELIEWSILEMVQVKGRQFPIVGFVAGARDTSLPVFGLFGGVHGLERIGTQFCLSYLSSLLYQIHWDRNLRKSLEAFRIVMMPLINPGGMYLGTRSNPQGVDLMRNAPVEADGISPWSLYSGHRLSARLPWYRGNQGAEMEKESKVLIRFVEKQVLPSRLAVTLDVHSGFGMMDRIWYPYAKSRMEFPRIRDMQALQGLFEQTYPHHNYQIGPQSLHYRAHGDLWDYLFDQHRESAKNDLRSFLPLTLEMGSWIWIKKNPIQFFSSKGLFNPIKKHRFNRVMRRHLIFLDFLTRAVQNGPSWLQTE